MKIAIHGPDEYFSTVWADHCKRMGYEYKMVDCRAPNVLQQVHDCDIVMWQHAQHVAADKLAARPILNALEHVGKIVFPNYTTAWHFDDKLAQKFLLEVIDAPLAPTHVFLTKESALDWLGRAKYPTVFKLRGGAGSANVRLVRGLAEGRRLVKRAFGRGFALYDPWTNLQDTWSQRSKGQATLLDVLKSLSRVVRSTKFARAYPPEMSYALFQDFLPRNTFDIRVFTVGGRACGLKRLVRPNDFRASGSGMIRYDRAEIDERCVRIAFETSERLNVQCMGYDFAFSSDGEPRILEMSYGFNPLAFKGSPGYWDRSLGWHEGPVWPVEWMVDLVVDEFQRRDSRLRS